MTDSRPVIKHNLDHTIAHPEIPIQQEQDFCTGHFPRPYDSNLVWQSQDPVVNRSCCENAINTMQADCGRMRHTEYSEINVIERLPEHED